MRLCRNFTIMAFALTLTLVGLTFKPAEAASGICPSNTTIYGTIREVHGKTLLVKTLGPHGFENIVAEDAKINYNDLTLRPNIFVGAFGCLNPETRKFEASELTLAYDAGTFPTGKRHIETITGVVREIHKGRILVETGVPHGFVNILTSDTDNIKVGDRVQATGWFNPDADFSASRVQDLTTKPPVARSGECPDQTGLSGTVREIHGKTLLVKSVGPHGFVNVLTEDTSVNYNGMTLRPGVFVEARGCFTENDRRFVASRLTLSDTVDSKPGTLTGTVREVHKGSVLVETGLPHGFVRVMTSDTAGIKVGERVQATGSFNSNGSFTATQVQAIP